MSKRPIFKITFVNQAQKYEIYAKHIHNSDLFGFIEVEQLLFGERTQVVVDPSEEKLKAEFDGVERTLIPLHSVVRIDQVSKQGIAKISEAKVTNVVAPFPSPSKPV